MFDCVNSKLTREEDQQTHGDFSFCHKEFLWNFLNFTSSQYFFSFIKSKAGAEHLPKYFQQKAESFTFLRLI